MVNQKKTKSVPIHEMLDWHVLPIVNANEDLQKNQY